jgi:ribonuclease R
VATTYQLPDPMKFTVADLLDQLSPEDPLPTARLEKALGLQDSDDERQLRIALHALAQLGLVAESEAGVERRTNPELIPARLRCSSKGFCFALRDDGGEDIYIREHLLNHAWNGDRVLVKVTREGGRRRSPEGGVQCILERHTTSLLAQVEQQQERLVATPLDDRLLTSVELPVSDADHLDPSQQSVVEVAIDRYPVAQFAPQGHVARRLPVNGGEEADLDLLLTKHRLHGRAAAPRPTLRTPRHPGRISHHGRSRRHSHRHLRNTGDHIRHRGHGRHRRTKPGVRHRNRFPPISDNGNRSRRHRPTNRPTRSRTGRGLPRRCGIG